MHRLTITLLLCLVSPSWIVAEEAFTLNAGRGENTHQTFGRLPEAAFQIDAMVDPSTKPGGNVQAVSALVLGWADESVPPMFRNTEVPHVAFELREGNGRGYWEVWIDGVNQTTKVPDPKPHGWVDNGIYQKPNVFREMVR